MLRKILRCLLALSAFACGGCATVTRHGDVSLYDSPRIDFLPQAVDVLEFPKTSLARVATYSYQVLNLPQEIYPRGFLLDVPENEDSRWAHDQPWRHCVIRVSLLTTDGKAFFSRRINFAKDWNGGSQEGSSSSRRKIWLPFTDYDFNSGTSSLPEHRSYVLRLEVLSPSRRSSDQLEIEAFTLLPDKKGA